VVDAQMLEHWAFAAAMSAPHCWDFAVHRGVQADVETGVVDPELPVPALPEEVPVVEELQARKVRAEATANRGKRMRSVCVSASTPRSRTFASVQKRDGNPERGADRRRGENIAREVFPRKNSAYSHETAGHRRHNPWPAPRSLAVTQSHRDASRCKRRGERRNVTGVEGPIAARLAATIADPPGVRLRKRALNGVFDDRVQRAIQGERLTDDDGILEPDVLFSAGIHPIDCKGRGDPDDRTEVAQPFGPGARLADGELVQRVHAIAAPAPRLADQVRREDRRKQDHA
jgi:hypothetical protein